jgi:hypothetical protein
MSVLAVARKAYAGVLERRKAVPQPAAHPGAVYEGNEESAPAGLPRDVPGTPSPGQDYEKNEIDEESRAGAGLAGRLVREPAELASVLQAVDESVRVGLDTETTGLDPRADRLRLLTLATELGHPLDNTNDDTLAGIDHPLAALLREYRAAQKLASTYGPGWGAEARHGGRIHAGWQQLGADSGRMACSKPNLQNLPRDKR